MIILLLLLLLIVASFVVTASSNSPPYFHSLAQYSLPSSPYKLSFFPLSDVLPVPPLFFHPLFSVSSPEFSYIATQTFTIISSMSLSTSQPTPLLILTFPFFYFSSPFFLLFFLCCQLFFHFFYLLYHPSYPPSGIIWFSRDKDKLSLTHLPKHNYDGLRYHVWLPRNCTSLMAFSSAYHHFKFNIASSFGFLPNFWI
ncbi:unnamed protein product [Acanthosepion pharaonis]|uniref:Uncharacterized protein n=1 Tax=Acanthosepion pharaonis TaxID=158019 RepID=A0A812DCM0_ACAPH|nr:unnamed protein product [Sepia pharaonis]